MTQPVKEEVKPVDEDEGITRLEDDPRVQEALQFIEARAHVLCTRQFDDTTPVRILIQREIDRRLGASPPLPEAQREEIARLEWSEAAPPCEDCRYDHVVATSPLGVFRIEWKSWKGEGDGHNLILNEEYLSSEYSLADAQEAAAAFLANKAVELAPFAALKNEEGRDA